MLIQFSVPFVVPKARPRVGSKGTYTVKRTVDAEKRVRDAYKGACVRKYGRVVTAPAHVPVMVAVTMRQACPQGKPKYIPKALWDAWGSWPFVRAPDYDNVLKLCCDALNPVTHKDKKTKKTIVDEYVAWHDDAQITEAHAYKLPVERGKGARTHITVFWKEEEDER